MDENKLTGLKIIHDYLKQHYEYIDSKFNKFDSKLVLIFTVFGVLFSFAGALLPYFINFDSNEAIELKLLTIIIFTLACIYIIRIFYEFINLFFLSHPIPNISDDLKIVENLNKINEAQIEELYRCFNDQYRDAIKKQYEVTTNRIEPIKRIKKYFFRCFICLIVTLSMLLLVNSKIFYADLWR